MAIETKSLKDARERAIARLTDLFAQDDIDVEEYDRRLSLAHHAATGFELEKLLADFPERPEETRALARPLLLPEASVEATRTVTAVLGAAERRGSWSVPRKLRVVAVMGGVELDFRDARFASGVSEVWACAAMGGVQVIVPPHLSVEVEGTGIMGAFAHLDRSPAAPDPEQPVLRVYGIAVMGGLTVETRLPGESDGEAAERRSGKHERRALRRAEKAARRALKAAGRNGERALPPHGE